MTAVTQVIKCLLFEILVENIYRSMILLKEHAWKHTIQIGTNANFAKIDMIEGTNTEYEKSYIGNIFLGRGCRRPSEM